MTPTPLSATAASAASNAEPHFLDFGPGDAIVVAEAPLTDDVADVVDELVLFDPILGPLGIEFELLTLLLGFGDWDEITGQAAGFYELVGDAGKPRGMIISL
jgi:hypothetical protein